MNRKPLSKILDILYPRICPICNEIVSQRGADICRSCERKLTYVGDSYCMRCGKPVGEDAEYCGDCMRIDHEYDEGCAALVYDEYMSKSIYRFKYNGKKEFAKFYARVMHERLGHMIDAWHVDGIIPVPVHKDKLCKRGYNQAALIAKELSARTKIPMYDHIVSRRLATAASKNLGAKERQNNLKKAFIVDRNVVKLDSVLIVDDIYTTGATVDAMARILKDSGVSKVYFATLCIGRGS